MALDESSCLKACLGDWLADLVITLLSFPGLGMPVTSTAVPIEPRTNGSSLPLSLNTCTSRCIEILNSSVASSVLSALPFFISQLLTCYLTVIGLP